MSGAALAGWTVVAGGGGGGEAVVERGDWATAGWIANAADAAISIDMVLRTGASSWFSAS
jgi:hypothetical protein